MADSTKAAASPAGEKLPEEVTKALVEANARARLVQILSRGVVNDRLDSIMTAAPSEKVGKFVRNRTEDIQFHQSLGYELAKGSELKVVGLHGDGTDLVVVGDVVLMLISADLAKVIEDVRSEEKLKKLSRGRKEYLANAERNGVPIINESN